MPRCKSNNCRAEIRWARNASSGKGVPIDPDPIPDTEPVAAGQVVRVSTPSAPGTPFDVRHLKAGDNYDGPRFWSHFATCPDSQKFSKSKPEDGGQGGSQPER